MHGELLRVFHGSLQGSKTHPREGSCMCPCTSLYLVKPCQHVSRKKQSYFNGHPLPDRPQPRGNSLSKRSFRDEVESLLGASIFLSSCLPVRIFHICGNGVKNWQSGCIVFV